MLVLELKSKYAVARIFKYKEQSGYWLWVQRAFCDACIDDFSSYEEVYKTAWSYLDK